MIAPVHGASRPLTDPSRLLRYAVAGTAAALVHLGTLASLVEWGGVPPVVASSVGFALGVTVSYALQRTWVYARRGPHRVLVPRFLTVVGVGLGLNALVLTLGTDLLGLHYAVAQAVALVLIPLCNYVLNSLWTFR